METVSLDVDLAQWARVAHEQREAGATFFDFLTAVDATDAPENPGFDVIAHLLVLAAPGAAPGSVMMRTRVGAGQSLPSLTSIFSGAAWHERETHEMFDIPIDGFDDGSGLGLRPLLLPHGFEGAPLRKEFVLAARSRPWPGAKEPGESSVDAPAESPAAEVPGAAAGAAAPAGPPRRPRRRVQAPGVPGPEWGPRTVAQVLAEAEQGDDPGESPTSPSGEVP